MTLATIRRALLYCTIINYVLLIVWYVILRSPHDWFYRFSVGDMGITSADFDRMMLNDIAIYKLLVVLFNLIPCISLYLVKSDRS